VIFVGRRIFVVARLDTVEIAGDTSVLAPSLDRCRRASAAPVACGPCPSSPISHPLDRTARPARPIAAEIAMLFAHASDATASPQRRGLAQHDV